MTREPSEQHAKCSASDKADLMRPVKEAQEKLGMTEPISDEELDWQKCPLHEAELELIAEKSRYMSIMVDRLIAEVQELRSLHNEAVKSSAEYARQAGELRQQMDTREHLERSFEKKQREVGELKDKNEELRSQIPKPVKHLAPFHGWDKAFMKKEIDELRAENEELRSHRDIFSKANDAWEKENEKLRSQLKGEAAVRDDLMLDNQKLRSRLAEQEKILLFKFEDLQANGKTILDFYSLWLQQEKSASQKLRAENERLKKLLEEN